MSDLFNLIGIPWWQGPGGIIALAGLALVWRGLVGGKGGKHGLLRRRAGALGRVEGWRLTIFGLALAGTGFAWLLAARWLLFLSLGIGFVEVLEASIVIAAWQRGARTNHRA